MPADTCILREIYGINGRMILIIRKEEAAESGGQPYLIYHMSWWQQELPLAEEMKEERRNLDISILQIISALLE